MGEIMRAVSAAGRRLWINRLLWALIVAGTAALIVLAVLRIAQQAFSLSVQWDRVALAAAGVAAVGAFAWSIATRPRASASARALDEAAGLRESLSTALSLGEPRDAWSKLVVDEAKARAAGVDVRKAIPIEAPRGWHWPVVAAVGLLLAWLMPGLDLLGSKASKEEEKARQQELIAVKQEVKENREELQKLVAKVSPELAQNLAEPSKPEEPKAGESAKPEQIRAAEMKRLTDLVERLEAVAQGEKGMNLDAKKDLMANLRLPGSSPLDQTFRAMSKGDFSAANKALSELKAKLGDNSLSEADKKKLAEALKNLADQLNKAGDANKELAKALEQAGADPKQAAEFAKQLAANPDLAKAAAEALKNLSPEQREQLAKQLAAKAKAAQQASRMSKSMNQAGECMSSGDMEGASEAMAEMGDQLSDAELSQAEMAALDAALSECRGQMAAMGAGMCEGNGSEAGWGEQQGEWSEGDSNRLGSGNGGSAGRAFGARRGSSPTDFAQTQEKIKTQTGRGPVIGRQYVKGEVVVGESRLEFAEAVEASSKAAAEALSNGEVPPELRGTVKAYFGRLRNLTKPAEQTKPAETKPADSKPAGTP